MDFADALACARGQAAAGAPRRAWRLARTLFRGHAEQPEPYIVSAEIVERLGERELAEFFREAARKPAAETLYDLGYALADLGEHLAAEPILERVTRLAPSLERAHLELGVVRSGLRDYPGAVAALRRASDLLESFWPSFELRWNEAMGVDLAAARAGLDDLSVQAEHPAEREAVARLDAILRRAAALGDPPADDLRAWHFIVNGAVLLRLAPEGARRSYGRHGAVRDTPAELRLRIERLGRFLRAAGAAPRKALHVDAASEALAGCVAEVLGLEVGPLGPAVRGVVCVADGAALDPEEVASRLRLRRAGLPVYVDARDYRTGGPVAEDATGALARRLTPWWTAADGSPRPAEEVRAAIRVPSVPSPRDPDTDERFDRFLARAAKASPLASPEILRAPFLADSPVPGR